MESMLSFFLSYLQLFVSFGIIFHILLPDSLVFNRLDNALVKARLSNKSHASIHLKYFRFLIYSYI
jgi:hypothetical protein